MHPLLSRPGIAQHNGTAELPIPRAVPHPADAGRKVKIIPLHAIGIEFARESKVRQRAATGWREGVLAFDAVQVAVEEAGVAVDAEEDERVSEGLEEGLDGGFERLVGLGIVIHDKGLVWLE